MSAFLRISAVALVIAGALLCGPTLLAQASAVVTGGASATPLSGASEGWSSLEWGFLGSSAIEYLKRNEWFKLLNPRTPFYLQRGIGIAAALVTASGVHASFVRDAQLAGHYLVDIQGLVFPSIWVALGESLRQFAISEVVYRTAIKTYKRPWVDQTLPGTVPSPLYQPPKEPKA